MSGRHDRVYSVTWLPVEALSDVSAMIRNGAASKAGGKESICKHYMNRKQLFTLHGLASAVADRAKVTLGKDEAIIEKRSW